MKLYIKFWCCLRAYDHFELIQSWSSLLLSFLNRRLRVLIMQFSDIVKYVCRIFSSGVFWEFLSPFSHLGITASKYGHCFESQNVNKVYRNFKIVNCHVFSECHFIRGTSIRSWRYVYFKYINTSEAMTVRNPDCWRMSISKFSASEPWPGDVQLFQPFEVEQVLLPDNANILAVQSFLNMANLEYMIEMRANAEHMSPSGKISPIFCKQC